MSEKVDLRHKRTKPKPIFTCFVWRSLSSCTLTIQIHVAYNVSFCFQLDFVPVFSQKKGPPMPVTGKYV